MFSPEFITFFVIIIFFTSKFFIQLYRRFILTYKIFGKRKKRDFETSFPIPNSCGLVFLIILILSSFIIHPFLSGNVLLNIIIGSTIICITGFWDDLKELSPYQKLFYQIIAVGFVVYFNNLEVTNLHGFLGIGVIPYWFGFSFSLFIGVFMINAFNLIDGIDGLAAFNSIVAFSSFAVLFWLINFKGFFAICIMMIGIMLSYIPFNLSKNRKVLMGDSGALLIGYLLFVMTMVFVNNNEPIIDRLIDRTILPIAPMIIFILPMVDTFSIYTYRLASGHSPFSADTSHLHHIILSRTKSHLMTSIIINSLSLFLLVVFSLLAFRLDSVSFVSLFYIVFFGLVGFISLYRSMPKFLKNK